MCCRILRILGRKLKKNAGIHKHLFRYLFSKFNATLTQYSDLKVLLFRFCFCSPTLMKRTVIAILWINLKSGKLNSTIKGFHFQRCALLLISKGSEFLTHAALKVAVYAAQLNKSQRPNFERQKMLRNVVDKLSLQSECPVPIPAVPT